MFNAPRPAISSSARVGSEQKARTNGTGADEFSLANQICTLADEAAAHARIHLEAQETRCVAVESAVAR